MNEYSHIPDSHELLLLHISPALAAAMAQGLLLISPRNCNILWCANSLAPPSGKIILSFFEFSFASDATSYTQVSVTK